MQHRMGVMAGGDSSAAPCKAESQKVESKARAMISDLKKELTSDSSNAIGDINGMLERVLKLEQETTISKASSRQLWRVWISSRKAVLHPLRRHRLKRLPSPRNVMMMTMMMTTTWTSLVATMMRLMRLLKLWKPSELPNTTTEKPRKPPQRVWSRRSL